MKVFEWEQDWKEAVKERDGYRCFICNQKEGVENELWVRRLVPPSRGGPRALSNGIAICQRCSKHVPIASGRKYAGKAYEYKVTEYVEGIE